MKGYIERIERLLALISIVFAGSTAFVRLWHSKSSRRCLPCFSEDRISVFIHTSKIRR